MRMLVGLVIAGVCLMACKSSFEEAPSAPVNTITISTPSGALEGVRDGETHIFRAIPYAMPPTGDRRWRAPEPMPAWDGIRQAKTAGPACFQPPRAPGVYYTELPPMSEDCLVLDVTAPAGASNAPVIVWIHGGTLIWGSSQSDRYAGHEFTKRGAILVSINYRLGPLGYLAHPELSAESADDVSGNYGLLDQVAALDWIRQNISAFGGDSGNVTIFGESAGALSVELLMASPNAQGLFHKAIIQSGYLYTMPELRAARNELPSAEDIGAYFAEQLGAGDIATLRGMEGEALTNQMIEAGYVPAGTVDGRILKRQLVETFDLGEQAPVPLIAGFNSGEIRSLRGLLPPLPDSAAAYEEDIRARYGDLADRYLEFYPPGDDADETRLNATRDVIFTWGIERMVRQQAAIGQPSYMYYFTHSYLAADEAGVSAFHAIEIPYVFGNLDQTSAHWPAIPDTAEERALSESLIDYWTSFAHTGTPSSANGPAWETFATDEAYMEFAAVPRAGNHLMPGVHELHEEIVCRRRRSGTQSWDWRAGSIAPPLPDDDDSGTCERNVKVD